MHDGFLSTREKTMNLKAAFSKLQGSPETATLHYFFCEAGEDGKPVLLIESKKIPREETEPVLEKAKKKGKSAGCMMMRKNGELVVNPVGTFPTSLAKGIQIAARNDNAMVFNGIVINPGEPEAAEGQNGAAAAAAPTPTPAPKTDPAAQWKSRWGKLQPIVLSALKAKPANGELIGRLVTLASARAEKQEYDKALPVLDQLEPLLKAPGKDPGAAADGARAKVAESLKVWAAAKDQADAEINKLVAALKRTGDRALADIANGMGLTLGKFKVGLTAELMSFDNSTGPARQKSYLKIGTILDSYRQYLETDNFIAGADANPLGVKVNIRSAMLAAVASVQATVDAVMK
jgi:hypothetical protein